MSTGGESPREAQSADAGEMRPARQVVARRVDAGTVLIHLRTNRIYELNVTGSRIWELLREGCDSGTIQTRLLQEFEVDEAEARRAIEDTLTSLAAEGLIERRE